MQLSATVRNAMIDAIETAIGTSPLLAAAGGQVAVAGTAAVTLEGATLSASADVAAPPAPPASGGAQPFARHFWREAARAAGRSM